MVVKPVYVVRLIYLCMSSFSSPFVCAVQIVFGSVHDSTFMEKLLYFLLDKV